MDRSAQLGNEKVGKLLLKFSVPAIVGMIVNALYNIIDTLFVGRGVGPLALSGTAVAFPIMIVLMAFGMLVGMGATALISIKIGEQKKEEAEAILGNALILNIIISLVLTILGLIFLKPILTSFGASSEVLSYAVDFTSIILLATVFGNTAFSMNSMIRAEGNPKIAMLTMIIGAVINTILNPIFIFVLHLGIKGSALATVISQIISATWVLSYFFSKKSLLKIRRKNLKLRWDIIKKIFAIGVSPFAMQIAASAITIVYNKSLAVYGGDLAIAAIGVITRIANLILMPIFGINQGAQPIIGFNFGAKKYDRVKEALKLAIYAATAVSVIGFLFVEFMPVKIISAFTKDPELIKVGAYGLRVSLMMLPIIGFQIVSSNYFQSVGKAMHSMFLSLSRQVIVLLPMLIILPKFFKLHGVWAAGPTADFISSVITATFLFLEVKKLNNMDNNEAAKVAVEVE
jgi:putative MATE family efflux protein